MIAPHEPETPAEVLAAARRRRAAADDAEAALLELAALWADVNPAGDDDDGCLEDEFLPRIRWDCPAEFALAVGLAADTGQRRIHQVVHLRHRMPRVWALVRARVVQGWRACRIAERTIGEPDDVCAWIDEQVAPIAHKVGLIKLEKLLDEAMLRLYPEEREQEQLDELDRREVRLFDQHSHNGVGEMRIRADLKDLYDFDAAVAEVAAELAELGDTSPLDVRRARAVGILADPRTALALLERSGAPAAKRKKVVLHLHLSDAAVAGLDPVGRSERGDRPLLEQQIRDWCGREDTHLTVLPVVDLNDHHAVDSYEIPNRLASVIDLRDHTCVFPWCTRPARRCDHDHTVEHSVGGQTCSCNIAPLCRRHHRMKTHTAWGYTTVEPGVYLWRSPHGYSFLRDFSGTLDVTPEDAARARGDGCQHHLVTPMATVRSGG
jgi:hypothetical protein